MELADIRSRIDEIDHELARLFTERLDLARDVAQAKAATGKAIFDPARERQKLADIASRVPAAHAHEAIALFSLLMSMNKAEQHRVLAAQDENALSARARAAMRPADDPFPAVATVACQGVEGSFSQIAASKLFRVPDITFMGTFEEVCRAVEDGTCAYGVLPIENSTAGSVNAVYDLIARRRFHIVRSVRMKVDHSLLAAPGARLEDIREIRSHEQALAQCAGFISMLGATPVACANTAVAAQYVAQSGRRDVAALASRRSGSLYGLVELEEAVQDSGSNVTRFVVIAREPAIYPGATKTSLMLTLPHEPGSLYRVLERLYALDINLVKLESRPIPDRDFEFVFYFDLDCPVGTEALTTLLDALDDICERVWYLGTYTEIA